MSRVLTEQASLAAKCCSSAVWPPRTCSPVQWRLQLCAVEAAALCSGGCGSVQWRLRLCAVEAAALCSGGCSSVQWRLQLCAVEAAALRVRGRGSVQPYVYV